jgi:tetratricopeptide (TPR) repeat protein
MALTSGWLLAAVLTAGPGAPQAQKLYDEGKYAQAAEMFGASAQAAPNDPSLQYNLGNALFKAGKTGRAIAAYQRAFDLAPRDSDIRQNLDFALRRAGDELVPSDVPPLLFRLFHFFSRRELAGLHWVFCWAALFLAGFWLLREGLRPSLTTPTAWVLGFWLLFGAWWATRLALAPLSRGVIVSNAAELRSGPGPNFSVGFTAPEGRRVEVLSESGSWLEVAILKEGAKGWIQAEAVERL